MKSFFAYSPDIFDVAIVLLLEAIEKLPTWCSVCQTGCLSGKAITDALDLEWGDFEDCVQYDIAGDLRSVAEDF